MSTIVTVDGPGVDIEREVSDKKVADIVQILLRSETSQDSKESSMESSEDEEEELQKHETLPESFFSHLSKRQEAYIQILLEADEWLTNEELREQLKTEHGLESAGPQAIAGIRSGFTRKYGKGFRVDEREWIGNQNQYRLNEQFREEIAAHFG